MIVKNSLIKGGNYVGVSGFDEKKMVWEIIQDHVAKDSKDNEYIELRGFF